MHRSLLSPLGEGESDAPSDVAEPLLLGLLSFAGYFVFYGQSIFLARNLTREEFNDYNVGVSSLLMLAALAPLGLEKLALKMVPIHLSRQEWPRLRGFIRFATFVAFVVSLSLTLAFDSILGSALQLTSLYGHLAIPLIVTSLPLLAVFSVFMEVATASGAPLRAAVVYRLALPSLMLGCNLLVALVVGGATGVSASGSFLVAWFSMTTAMALLVRSRLPPQVGQAEPTYNQAKWLGEATPLLLHGLLLTAIAQSGVIVLELSESHHAEASVFAVAMQTGTVIVLFATSVNRFYLPRVSVLLKNRNTASLIQLVRRRLQVVGTICIGFVVLVMGCGQFALRAHGPGFEEGYLATCIIAVGASISTTFSLAPFGLHFTGMNRYVLTCIGLTTFVSIASSVVLSDRYGAVGAAIAYSLPLIALHLWLAYKSRRLLEAGFVDRQ